MEEQARQLGARVGHLGQRSVAPAATRRHLGRDAARMQHVRQPAERVGQQTRRRERGAPARVRAACAAEAAAERGRAPLDQLGHPLGGGVPSDRAGRRELAEELEEEGRVALEAASREGERGGGEPQLSRLAYVRAEAV